MSETGSSSASDVLAFAALVSISLVVLSGISPAHANRGELKYAAGVARNIVLITTAVQVGELGGLEYRISRPPCSSGVRLNDRTLAQLVGEFWALRTSGPAGLSSDMGEKIEQIVRGLVQRFACGRFCYRWKAEVLVPWEEYPVFSLNVENTHGAKRFICAESLVVPFSPSIITGSACGPAAVRVKLELWSM